MKERGGDPRALNVLAFCKDSHRLSGVWPLSGMARLGASFFATTDAGVDWEASGEHRAVSGAEPQISLVLRAQALVPLQCQRCLGSMMETLVVERRFVFVRSEEEALRLDEDSEDDVLSLPARLDLHELLEDELILALPIVPRHPDACPQPLPGSAELTPGLSDGATEAGFTRPHAFAALAALKRGKPGSD